MQLPARMTGAGTRVVLVHGFTQTGASWDGLVPHLGTGFEIVTVDAPGHGAAADQHLDLPQGAAALAETGGRAVYVGYSMGGRLCLRLALDRPELVAGLVLIGATAGIDDPGERADRRAADEALAATLDQEARAGGGVDAFLDRWLAQPLFAGVPHDPAERAARATNTAAGLAGSLRLAGTGTMDPPWWDELGRLATPQPGTPTLIVAGERDDKFRRLAERLAAGIGPSASTSVLGNSGHAVPLEQPHALAAEIRRFVAELPDESGREHQPDGEK